MDKAGKVKIERKQAAASFKLIHPDGDASSLVQLNVFFTSKKIVEEENCFIR